MTTIAKQTIIDAIETGVAAAPGMNVPTWLGATDSLIELFALNGHPYSSGEVAAHLRTFRPDLVFSVTQSVGEHVRERFYAGTLPLFTNPDGSSSPAEQVPRTTEGIGRTPPHIGVFVYAPSYTDGFAHEFEVDIPKPGVALPLENDGLPAVPAQPTTPAAHFVKLAPRKAATNLEARVHKDSRCYVPRSAFEELLHETQTSLKGGDMVYVFVDDANKEAIVSLDRTPGSQGYTLVATRGRVLFPHPAHPFTIGDTFPITVDGPGRRLVVDLS